MKKIAVPVANNSLSTHFGHAEHFMVFTTDGSQITGHETHSPPPHQPGTYPRWLASLGVTDIIAGGMGQRAIDIFLENGINVYTGVNVATPEELVTQLLNGTLVAGVNLCDH
jgi:predicted Fe-Mo cluster-binding NifX family protein